MAVTTVEQAVVIPMLMLSALIYATIFGNMVRIEITHFFCFLFFIICILLFQY